MSREAALVRSPSCHINEAARQYNLRHVCFVGECGERARRGWGGGLYNVYCQVPHLHNCIQLT